MKILYICPFAHYSGHHPHVATVEPERLANTGLDVTLLTFNGIINNTQVSVKHLKVLNPDKHTTIHKILRGIRVYTLPRWIMMLIETTLTLFKATRIAKDYDVLHLRDGEPFLFLSHILSLPYKGHKWAISLTAAIVFKPKLRAKGLFEQPFVTLYTLALYWVNSRMWKPLYKLSLKRNKFTLMPQNQVATKGYREYMDGIFADNVTCVEWGIDRNGELPNKEKARKHLGIPQGAFTLLSFGAPHSGKNMETIFQAIRECPNVYLIHGGTHTFSLGSNPVALADKYNLNGRAKIFNYFIPEDEKPYFFGAADVSVLSYTKAFASTSSMIWESSKYKLPVISSDANTLGKDVEKYRLGVLFEAENSESLVRAINLYTKLPEKRIKQFRENCGKFLRDHSETRWAENCIEVYKELLNDSKTKYSTKKSR